MNSALHHWRRWLGVALLTSAAALNVRAVTLHVWQESTAPTPPYDSWSTAARTIQDAVDAASPGDIVLVTNGVYAFGGRVVATETNRVAVQKAITVRSVNGPDLTVVKGAPGNSLGEGGVRCVYLGEGAALDGLTLTEGYTEGAGGGVYCETNAVVTNCVLRGNVAGIGGGVYLGTLFFSQIVDNRATGEGGGAYMSTLVNCRLSDNVATFVSGGASGGILRNCIVAGNRAEGFIGGGRQGGGGAGGAVLYNCTVTGNTAQQGGGLNSRDATTVLSFSIQRPGKPNIRSPNSTTAARARQPTTTRAPLLRIRNSPRSRTCCPARLASTPARACMPKALTSTASPGLNRRVSELTK